MEPTHARAGLATIGWYILCVQCIGQANRTMLQDLSTLDGISTLSTHLHDLVHLALSLDMHSKDTTALAIPTTDKATHTMYDLARNVCTVTSTYLRLTASLVITIAWDLPTYPELGALNLESRRQELRYQASLLQHAVRLHDPTHLASPTFPPSFSLKPIPAVTYYVGEVLRDASSIAPHLQQLVESTP